MYINHNGMASTVANNLTSHYSNLSTSTQRLSSGLRVNSAADDAAGLAIRELMRADISALQQGVRNANDGISLIQTADGALGIIDEKLIRMKELAEQAATGTYDSTQRLMIESEYQAMASEITRIANATDFNNMKLLDGSLEGTHDGSKLDSSGALKVHFGSGNDSAEDYYYIEIEEMTAQALGVGNASTMDDVKNRAMDAFEKNLTDSIKASNLSDGDKGQLLSQVAGAKAAYGQAIENAMKPANAYDYWTATDAAAGDEGFLADGKTNPVGNTTLLNEFLTQGARTDRAANVNTIDDQEVKPLLDGIQNDAAVQKAAQALKDGMVYDNTGALDLTDAGVIDLADKLGAAMLNAAAERNIDVTGITLDNTNILGGTGLGDASVTDKASLESNFDKLIFGTGDRTTDEGVMGTALKANAIATGQANAEAALDTFWKGLRDTEQEKLRYAFGQAAIYNLGTLDPAKEAVAGTPTDAFGIGVADATFGFGNDSTGTAIAGAMDMLKGALGAGYEKTKDMDFAGHTIETQEDAQMALNAINDAIVKKDKTRAHLGALQNRLENTVSNLTVQAENLQSAESRISDVDVATEMTNFVRNQILTQSAVAMLGQANSMPQMAMQLIG